METQEKQTKKVVSKKVSEQSPKKSKRVYKGQKEVDHDLYKLLAAPMIKNQSWWTDRENLVGLEHCHMFHTIDSNGKEQFYSSQVGGHQHKITFERDDDGMIIPESVKIGPPVRRTKSGDIQLVVSRDKRGNVSKYDTHTHEMEYILSERIKVRQRNEEAAKRMAEFMQKTENKFAAHTTKVGEAETNVL